MTAFSGYRGYRILHVFLTRKRIFRMAFAGPLRRLAKTRVVSN
jgi:hypothetical protein